MPNISTKKIAVETKISQQSMYILKRQKFHLYKTHYVQETQQDFENGICKLVNTY